MASAQGVCDPQFSEVKSLLEQFVASGEELGASVTVNLGGKTVVDIWAGYKDEERSQPWESDTIAAVFSMTKMIATVAVLVLVDRGLVNLDDKVSQHWPEFAQNGKQDIQVRHILSHTSGVAGFDEPLALEEIYDIPKLTALIETQAPWWEPGTMSGYHSLTHGYLSAELVRRVSGKTLGRFIAEDMAGPLGADFQLGCSSEDESRGRVSNVVPPPPEIPPPPEGGFPRLDVADVDTSSVGFRVLANPPTHPSIANSEAFRRGELGAGNGHTNARGIADILSVISLAGAVSGNEGQKPFISAQTINQIFTEQVHNVDLVLPFGQRPIRWGVGFALTGPDTAFDWLPSDGKVCIWGGFGGSIGVMDLKRGLTVTYVMNRMEMVGVGSERSRAYVAAVYRALGWNGP